jgi:hypothetical protein
MALNNGSALRHRGVNVEQSREGRRVSRGIALSVP